MRLGSKNLITAFAVLALAGGAQASGNPPPDPGNGEIGDFVWHDLNGNGLQDDGEPGIPGVHVVHKLLSPDGGEVIQGMLSITDENGHYSFTRLPVESGIVDGGRFIHEVNVVRHLRVLSDGTFEGFGPLAGLTPTDLVPGAPLLDSNFVITSTTLDPADPIDLSLDFGFVGDAGPSCELAVDASCQALDLPSSDACESGKLSSLVLEFVGGGCAADDNDQGSKASCEGGVGAASPVDALATNPSGKVVYADVAALAHGDRITVLPEPGRSTLKSEVHVVLDGGAEELSIHTSCSAPIAIDDRFGSLRVVGLGTDSGLVMSSGGAGPDCSVVRDGEVEFHYEITNLGPADAHDITVGDTFEPNAGSIDFLGSGDSASVTLTGVVWDDMRGLVTATAAQCTDGGDWIHVKVIDDSGKKKKAKKSKSKKAKKSKAKKSKSKKSKSKKLKDADSDSDSDSDSEWNAPL